MVKLNWFYKTVIFIFLFIVIAQIVNPPYAGSYDSVGNYNFANSTDLTLIAIFFVLWIGISLLVIKIIQGDNTEQPKPKKKR